MLLIVTPNVVSLPPWGPFLYLLTLPAALYGLLRYRAAGHSLDADRLVLRFRRLARTTVIVPQGRLQSRGYSVSPFQKRLNLATLRVEVASGSGGTAFRLSDMEAKTAFGLVEVFSQRIVRPASEVGPA